MNESKTRAEYIDPKLKASGWGEVEDSKVLREFRITDGKIQTGGVRRMISPGYTEPVGIWEINQRYSPF